MKERKHTGLPEFAEQKDFASESCTLVGIPYLELLCPHCSLNTTTRGKVQKMLAPKTNFNYLLESSNTNTHAQVCVHTFSTFQGVPLN